MVTIPLCVDKAVIFWNDGCGNIKNLKRHGDYLTFEMSGPLYCGNALIAVCQGNDVVWSYHLWVTMQDAYSMVNSGYV